MHLLSLVIGSLLLSGSSNHAETITFSCPGATVENALKQLSEATSLKLEASDEVCGLPIIIDVTDMPQKELLDGIADALSCQWSDEKGKRLLAPSATLRKNRNEAARKHAIAGARRSADNFYRKVSLRSLILEDADKLIQAAMESDSTQQDEIIARLDYTPSTLLESIIAEAIEPEIFLKLKEGDRLVFAEHPTKMQKPYTAGIKAGMKEFYRLKKLFWDRLANANFDVNLILDPDTKRNVQRVLDWEREAVAGQVVLSKDIMLNIQIDDRGAETDYLTDRVEEQTLYQRRKSIYDSLKVTEPSEKYAFSTESLRTVQAVASYNVSMMNAPPNVQSLQQLSKLTPIERQVFLKPLEFDPQSIYVGPAICAAAKLQHLNLIASVTDACLDDLRIWHDSESALSEDILLRFLMLFEDTSADLLVVNGHTIVIRQDFTDYDSYPPAVDRRVLAELIPRIVSSGVVKNSEAEKIGRKRLLPNYGLLSWIQATCPSPLFMEENDNRPAEFLGMLSEAQRNQLYTGHSLVVSSLSRPQKELLEKMVFGSKAIVNINDPVNEITRYFENGLPSNAKLSAQFNKDLMVRCTKVVDGNCVWKNIWLPHPGVMNEETLGGYDRYLPIETFAPELNIKWQKANVILNETNVNQRVVAPAVDDWHKLPREFLEVPLNASRRDLNEIWQVGVRP